MGESTVIAVIVAGGKGTRLQDVCGSIPKPMAPVGGKPVLEHQVELLQRAGAMEIHVLIGHLGHVIERYFGNGDRFGVTIRYHRESTPMGTAGCLAPLEQHLIEPFVLLYGDLMLNMDVADFFAFHREKGGAASLAVHPNDHPQDSDLVVLGDNRRVTRFLPKSREPGWYSNCVSAAAYVLSPAVFRYIPAGCACDFVKDVFPAMLSAGEPLYGYRTIEYIKDMGTPERYRQVNLDYQAGKISRMERSRPRPAIFMDRDGTLVEEIDLLHRVDDLHLFPFSARAVKRINDSGFLAFVATNQPVVARGLCGVDRVDEIHRKLETCLGEQGAYIDDIFFCPHHPDRGFHGENPAYKVSCECRKPNTGMIRSAASTYPIDVAASWMIGDRTSDIQTGVNAGMMTALVRTGVGGKDDRFHARPDGTFDTLDDAVEFITEIRSKLLVKIDPVVGKAVSHRGDKPFVIAVGGQARSGKSTVAALLERTLRARGVGVRLLSLDHWLIAAPSRTDDMTVRERFRYPDIEQDVARLSAGERVCMNRYDMLTRTVRPGEEIALKGADCLVIEGVPALDIAALRELASVRPFVEAPEEIRRGRFFAFYRWKGMPERDIDTLYHRRLIDEVPFIAASRTHADLIIDLQETNG